MSNAQRYEIDAWDSEELAAAVLGLAEQVAGESRDYDERIWERFGVNMDQFSQIASALMEFTIPSRGSLSGKSYVGYVKNGVFLTKHEQM